MHLICLDLSGRLHRETLTCVLNSGGELSVFLGHHVLPVGSTHAHTPIAPLQFKVGVCRPWIATHGSNTQP